MKQETRVWRCLYIGDIIADTSDRDVRNSRVLTTEIGVFFFLSFSFHFYKFLFFNKFLIIFGGFTSN